MRGYGCVEEGRYGGILLWYCYDAFGMNVSECWRF